MDWMHKSLGAIVAAAVLAPAAHAGQPSEASVRTAIASVLDDSARGWNGGDLDRFMAAYERGPRTTYVSGGKVVSGFEAIRAAYQPRFAAGPGAMGRLTLTLLDVRVVRHDHAYVVGRFRLHRDGAGDVEGLTTLLFRRSGTAWRIVADHS